jgi:hypothetical protein
MSKNLTWQEADQHNGIACVHRAKVDDKTVYLIHRSNTNTGTYWATRIETVANGTVTFWVGQASTVAALQALCEADHAAS